jgi:hypothetical protein
MRANPESLTFTEQYCERGIAHYAALVQQIGDAAERGAPAFLDDVEAREHTGRAAIINAEQLHYAAASTTTEEANRLLTTLRDLMVSEGFGRALAASSPLTPTSRYSRPRVALVHPEQLGHSGKAGEPGMGVYTCALTRKKFSLAKMAAVPCLLRDLENADGSLFHTGCVHPADNNPRCLVIHPGLLMAGPEYVLSAYWAHVSYEVEHHLEMIAVAIEDVTLLFGTEPKDVLPEWPDRALFTWGDWHTLRPEVDGTRDKSPLTDAECDALRVRAGWCTES